MSGENREEQQARRSNERSASEKQGEAKRKERKEINARAPISLSLSHQQLRGSSRRGRGPRGEPRKRPWRREKGEGERGFEGAQQRKKKRRGALRSVVGRSLFFPSLSKHSCFNLLKVAREASLPSPFSRRAQKLKNAGPSGPPGGPAAGADGAHRRDAGQGQVSRTRVFFFDRRRRRPKLFFRPRPFFSSLPPLLPHRH